MDRKDANAHEVHAIEFIAGLDAQLSNNERYLEKRLKSIPDGWRKYRCAKKLLEQVIDGLYDTLPTKTMLHMQRLLNSGEIVIRPKPIIRDYVQIIPNDTVEFLINEVIKNNCALCLDRGSDVKKCKIRKIMVTIAPTGDYPKDGSCCYQHVAQGHAYGDYLGEALEDET